MPQTNNMQKPLIKRWYVVVTIVILCIATLFLLVKSFLDGYEEGQRMRQQIMREHE
jgi:hypothetical protein